MEDAFPENGIALNSRPRWLVGLPGPCARRLCLPETRCPTRGAGGTHPSLGWRPKPLGCVEDHQQPRGGFLDLGETGSDWTSSVKRFHGTEVLVLCSVLLGVTTASLFTGLIWGAGQLCRLDVLPWHLLCTLPLPRRPALWSAALRAFFPAQDASKDVCRKEGVTVPSSPQDR